MKIYLLTTHTAIAGEFLGVNNSVHATREDALKAFEIWRAYEIECVRRDNWTIGTDKEDHFEAFEEGYWCTDHTEGFISECEL